MDLFAEALASSPNAATSGERTASTKLRRVHFNAFIMECHRRLHAHSLAVAHELKEESRRAAAVAAEAAAEDVVAGDGILKRPAPEGVDHETGVGAARFRASPPSLSSLETSRPWDAVAELVRKLVAEPGAPETGTNLDQALDRISQSILESTQDGGAHPAAAAAASAASAAADTATDSESDARVETDPHGRPVSAGVLCFDEVQMMDIADATIVSGVLSRLFDAGWVLVATCNRTPDEFARSTMHREHPQARFTARILECCESVHLRTPVDEASGEAIDYRQTLRACLDEPTYISPLGPTTEQTLDGRFADALSGGEACETSLPISAGRSLRLLASDSHGVARTSFTQLCASTLGAADYIALAQRFHTLFLTDVPQLSLQHRDQARRFITLIDQLYNHRTKLVATAAVPLPLLFDGKSSTGTAAALMSEALEGLEFEGEAGKTSELNPIGVSANSLASDAAANLARTARVGADTRKRLARDSLFTGEDEVFAFRRALSRLQEMGSIEYLARSGRARGFV